MDELGHTFAVLVAAPIEGLCYFEFNRFAADTDIGVGMPRIATLQADMVEALLLSMFTGLREFREGLKTKGPSAT